MLFLNILKLVWLRWSIVTFFQWQFFGTGRLHLYLLLPFATNDNLDIEANLQYDFWIAGWLANNQQTKCRYKLSPKQFTHEVHAYNGPCWTFLIEATSRQHGMGHNPLRLSSSHSTFLSQHHNWMMGQHICNPIIHKYEKIVKNCRSVEFEKLPAVISNLRVGDGLFAQTCRPARTCCPGRNPTLATANVILFKG